MDGRRASNNRQLVDISGTLAERAIELKLRLAELGEESMRAHEQGLDRDPEYMEDLESEFAATLRAYEGAVILQLSSLRTAIDGPRKG